MHDSDDTGDGSVQRMNVLYLMAELEHAIGRDGVMWTANDAEQVPERLIRLASTVRQRAGN